MSEARLLVGDVFAQLATIEPGTVDLAMTSPPFWNLRDYLAADDPSKLLEHGREGSPGEYLQTQLSVVGAVAPALAAHGSIAWEIGDTFAGSGGAGGDYNEGGFRDGQPKFQGSASASNGRRGEYRPAAKGETPLDKSLCGIPTLFAWSLAYGRNLLTGEPSPAGQWIVRNVVVWARPNPPVGALFDKFRPATSYLTIATRARDRYFDLDAVRVPNASKNEDRAIGRVDARERARMAVGLSSGNGFTGVNEGGTPPNDWWEPWPIEQALWDWWADEVWNISTRPYAGSHYAVFPPALCVRPIKTMCPERVCRTCRKPSTRIVEKTTENMGYHQADGGGSSTAGTGRTSYSATTLGWTDCGCMDVFCRSCGVLVPYDYALRGSSKGQSSQGAVSAQAVLGESVEVPGESTNSPRQVPDLRREVSGPEGSASVQQELLDQVGAPRGPDADDPTADDDRTEGRAHERLCQGVGPDGDPGPSEERLHDGASTRDAGAPRETTGTMGDRSPSERGEERQPDPEPGGRHAESTSGDGDVSSLSDDVRGQLNGYECPCGKTNLDVKPHDWRPGCVLDPYAGSGTTLAVATGHGRDAIGIDLDQRNADLVRDRVGMFLTDIVEPLRDVVPEIDDVETGAMF